MEKLKNKLFVYYILSKLIPMIIMLAALAGLGVTPFGDKSLVISDGNGLYINYLGYVGRAVKGQEGLLFSFEKGLGGNMMGSWGWFLLNPFFVLFSLVDVTQYMAIYTWVSTLSFAVCGLTMYILLRDIYGHRISNLIFSTSYALNGFLVANVFQMNFFAVIPVLPLMVLGLRKVLQNKNPLLYIITIAYSLLINFYFGFMLCVASLILFLVFFISEKSRIENRKSVTLKYIISSFLGGVASSIVWLPALLSLRGGRLDQNISSFISTRENMPFLDMFSKLFTGANSTTELSNGLPNIFVGILPIFLVILFFMNRKIEKRKKITAGILLCFYLLSFYIAIFNIVMHGGTVTNWFNYRDSFVFCFLMLMIAAEEWQYIIEEPEKNLKKAAVILIICTLLVFNKRFEYLTGGFVVLDLIILALMYLPLWMHKKDPIKNSKRAFEAVVMLFVCINLFLNYNFSTKNIMEWGKTESEYQQVVTPVSAMVDAVHKSDDSFYRMEIGEQRSGNLGNDPMLYGYDGVGHGGSDDRDFVRTALSKLGVRRFNMRNSYGQGIPAATDNLLGLKYIISKDDLVEEKGYERLVDLGEWILYKNSNALPIAVVSNTDIKNVQIDIENIFENLNKTWSSMTGVEEDIFTEENDVVFTSHNITDPLELMQKDAASIVSKRDEANAAKSDDEDNQESNFEADTVSDDLANSNSEYLENNERGTYAEKPENTHLIQFTFTASRDGAIYSYNRSGMTEDNGSMLPALNYEGYHHKGDVVTRYLPVPNSFVTEYLMEEVAGRFKIAYADADVLAQMSATLLNRLSNIEKVKENYLRGEFTAEKGQELLFTIPYDEGWKFTVDGKETELKKALEVFMAAEVEPGTHAFEMKFVPSGLKAGVGGAAAAVVLIVCYVLLDSRKRKKTVAITTGEMELAEIRNEE